MSAVTKICQSLVNEPENWIQGDAKMVHMDGTAIWTANGRSHVKLYSPEVHCNWTQRRELWAAIKEWRRRRLYQIGERLTTGNQTVA